MEIGSFIELQFPTGMEFFRGDRDVARLNSGRAAIWHACRVLGCGTVWLPHYQCDTVRRFLAAKGMRLRFYHIDRTFTPTDLRPGADEAVLLVNWYGVMSHGRMAALADGLPNVIVDDSQAFFCPPVGGCLNVYSCRKFVGVPDGAYVVGRDAHRFVGGYLQGYSSDTSLFLLQRIEYGCEGRAYASRSLNEARIDREDCSRMSALTRRILDGTDYALIVRRRRENFRTACALFGPLNAIDASMHHDDDCVPMVYPLVVEDDGLLDRLRRAKHFQGHWWSFLLDEMPPDSFEYWLSRYIVPITIDQRYDSADLAHLLQVVQA